MSLLDMGYVPTPRDWVDDFPHENGSYQRECIPCKQTFYGHKRRHICKQCYDEAKAKWDAMSPEEQEEAARKRDQEINEALQRLKRNDHDHPED